MQQPKTVNGHEVIGFFSSTETTGVVLVRRDGAVNPFVTWALEVLTDAQKTHVAAYWGHYHETEEEARKDFADRCKRGF